MSSRAVSSEIALSTRERMSPLQQAEFDYGILSDLTGFSVKLAWVLGHELLSYRFGNTGITPHRFSVLEVIGRNPGLQQSRLATALSLSRPATTLAIDFWEERECVERRKVRGDRRSFGVFTTPLGTQTLEELRRAVSDADAQLTANLSMAEKAELHRLLTVLRG